MRVGTGIGTGGIEIRVLVLGVDGRQGDIVTEPDVHDQLAGDVPVILSEEGNLFVREEWRSAGVAATDEGRVIAQQEIGDTGTGVLRPNADAVVVTCEKAADARAVLILTFDGTGAPAVQVAVLANAQVAAELKGMQAANDRQRVREAEVVRGEIERAAIAYELQLILAATLVRLLYAEQD